MSQSPDSLIELLEKAKGDPAYGASEAHVWYRSGLTTAQEIIRKQSVYNMGDAAIREDAEREFEPSTLVNLPDRPSLSTKHSLNPVTPEDRNLLDKQIAQWTKERDRLNDMIAFASGNPESSQTFIEKLTAIKAKLETGPTEDNLIMRAWDKARECLLEDNESDFPRMVFEGAADELLQDVCDIIDDLQRPSEILDNKDAIRRMGMLFMNAYEDHLKKYIPSPSQYEAAKVYATDRVAQEFLPKQEQGDIPVIGAAEIEKFRLWYEERIYCQGIREDARDICAYFSTKREICPLSSSEVYDLMDKFFRNWSINDLHDAVDWVMKKYQINKIEVGDK